jgi:hypothetical protein
MALDNRGFSHRVCKQCRRDKDGSLETRITNCLNCNAILIQKLGRPRKFCDWECRYLFNKSLART